MAGLWFETALLPDGWATDVRIDVADGAISSIETGVGAAQDDERHAVAVPGLPNLHSHAFQRAMAGMAEVGGGADHDDFWSWRDLMYRLVADMTPDDLEVVAAMAFVEMLESGFTRVGEFHYLHHQPSGASYADVAEMAAAIAAASVDTGIALTLLPVFYAHADFGGAPLNPGQRRFRSDLDSYARLLDRCRQIVGGLDGGVLGMAPHSLRAVTPGELVELLALAPSGAVHIHVAEQRREVDACLAWSGQRPVAWLLDHMPVDARWCLVHATHTTPRELTDIVASGAVVGLCPITEANLGDGLFPAADFLRAGGRFGVGSDSNVRIDAAEELRLLEYGQRLTLHRRNVLAQPDRSTGGTLFDAALAGGGQALGRELTGLFVGAPADVVALSADDLGFADDRSIDRWLFSRGQTAIASVWRAGRRVVSEGRHVRREQVTRRYREVIRRRFG
jgi:formiminoglutamate deiminase